MTTVENATMIGKSVEIHGELSGSEDLIMDGELHGTIKLPGHRLTIGPAARVRGDVAAKDVVVFGRIDGDIRATGRAELRATALMQGNIYAGSLSIEENAAFRGHVDPSRAQEPIPERPAVASRSPASKSVAVSPVTPTPLSAAPATRTVSKDSATAPPNVEPDDAAGSAPLFAETKA